MIDQHKPLPPELWERLQAFLQGQRTGKITLNVKDGQIQTWELTEVGRASAPVH